MKRFFKAAVIALTLVYSATVPVHAATIDYSANDINYYDPRGNSICSAGGGATAGAGNTPIVSNTDNEKTIFFTMLANGFTKIQAAAAMGNIAQESMFNPRAIEGNGVGHGIIQWSEPGRWDTLQSVEAGKDPWAIATQLDFMFYELTHVPQYQKAFADFKATTTLADGVRVWGSEYEIFGDNSGPTRLNFAEGVTKESWYISATDNSGNTGPTSSGSSTSSTSCSGATSQTGSGNFVDGFVVYSQCDPAWADKPYASTTICPSGCGPSAMAMIITNLTGQHVTPDIAANYAASAGMYVPGAGSSWSIGPVLAKHWNLKSQAIGADQNAINAALRAGALVITSGQGPIPFTSGGHFIVIRAVTADGKWLVGDSAHASANSTKFNPQDILPYANGGSVYAISK